MSGRGLYFIVRVGTCLSYRYQLLTLWSGYISRYAKLYSFFKLPRIAYAMFRFSEVTLSVEHMVYFASRLRLINMMRIFYQWTPPVRSKSRRWKRKFWNSDPALLCHTLFTFDQFVGFWQTFMVMYMSHLTYKGFFKKVGTGGSLLHWFRRTNMYWEYPYMWCFFSSNMAVHYELMNYLLKIKLTSWRRTWFMMDRDTYRILNFPIQLFSLPRLWQPDPAKFVLFLRRAEADTVIGRGLSSVFN